MKLISFTSLSLKTIKLRYTFGSFFQKKKIQDSTIELKKQIGGNKKQEVQHMEQTHTSFFQKKKTIQKVAEPKKQIKQVKKQIDKPVNHADIRDAFQKQESTFEKTLSNIEPEALKIITKLRDPNRNIREITKMLDIFLQFHGQSLAEPSIHVQPRKPEGLIQLLQIVCQSSERSIIKYKAQIVEHLIRNDLQELVLPSEFIQNFFTSLCQQQNKQFELARGIRSLFIMMNTLNNSFQNIKFEQYLSIFHILNSNKRYENTLYVFVEKIQKKLHDLFMEILALPPEKFEEYGFLNLEFLREYTNILSNFEPKEEEYVGSFLDILLKRYIPIKQNNSVNALHQFYLKFPNGFKDKNGIEYKETLFQTIIRSMKDDTWLVNYLLYGINGGILFSAVLIQYFNKMSQALTIREKDGFTYIPASEIKEPPVLPSFIWQLYSKNPAAFNINGFIVNVVKDCYPQFYLNQVNKVYLDTKQPYLDTQMKIRAQIALQNLGIQHQQEAYISGRYVDFLLADKIVLEIDGIYHYSYRSLKLTPNANYRNMHLTLIGYRIILINIFEYNLKREISELQELIKTKLDILKVNDAAIVF